MTKMELIRLEYKPKGNTKCLSALQSIKR